MNAYQASVVTCLAAIFVGFSPASSYAQIGLCPWTATNSEPVRTKSNNIVEWGSTVDLADGGLWNFATYVINLDKGGPRNIDWDAAGMRVEGLQPMHYAHLCNQKVQGRGDRTGPLYFARDQSAMATTVYWGGPPPTQKETVVGKPLTLASQFIVSARDTKNRLVHVQVTTEVVRTESEYRITYTVENLSDQDVVVDFPIDPATATRMGDGKLYLKKGEKRRADDVTTTIFPQMVRFPVRISEPSKDGASAIVHVPTARKPVSRG